MLVHDSRWIGWSKLLKHGAEQGCQGVPILGVGDDFPLSRVVGSPDRICRTRAKTCARAGCRSASMLVVARRWAWEFSVFVGGGTEKWTFQLADRQNATLSFLRKGTGHFS